ncbi:MAG: nitroreductase family protein [Bacteriovoracaceae bacterium]|nr:nitroreductase family protein [Bacteriovoracaceae bacterium]
MLQPYKTPNVEELAALSISRDLSKVFTRRRTIRQFSPEKPNRELIENAVDVARLSPSGANRQPWTFAIIESVELKKEIRVLSEIEEKRFYIEKPNHKWVEDLKHLHTNCDKEFLTQAPYLIVIFYSHFSWKKSEKITHYYAKESAGIATGMLISALHMCGLSTLTYTPKRMQFLSQLLDRPQEERPFMLLGVGKPSSQAMVPTLAKKTLDQVMKIYS